MISPEFWYLFPCVSLPPSLPFFLLHRLKAGLKKKSKLQPKSSSKRELDKYYDMVLVSLGKYQATETNWTSIPHSSFHRLHSNDTILASHKYTLSVAQPSAYIIHYHHDLYYDCDIIIPMFYYDNIMTSLTFMKFVHKRPYHVTTCLSVGDLFSLHT